MADSQKPRLHHQRRNRQHTPVSEDRSPERTKRRNANPRHQRRSDRGRLWPMLKVARNVGFLFLAYAAYLRLKERGFHSSSLRQDGQDEHGHAAADLTSSDACPHTVFKRAASPLLNQIESAFVDLATLPPAYLLYGNLSVHVSVDTMSPEEEQEQEQKQVPVEQILDETFRQIRMACAFPEKLFRDDSALSEYEKETYLGAAAQMKQHCSALGNGKIAEDTRYQLAYLNMTLGAGAVALAKTNTGTDTSKTVRGYDWAYYSANYLSRIRQFLETVRYCSDKPEGLREYQLCNRMLLLGLNTTLSPPFSQSGPGRETSSLLAEGGFYGGGGSGGIDHVAVAQRHIRKVVAEVRKIHGEVLGMKEAARVLGMHPAVERAWERVNRENHDAGEDASKPASGEDGNDSEKKEEPLKETIVLLRHANAANALAHLDRTALLPLARRFKSFDQQLLAKVVKPLDDIRETIKTLMNREVPSLVQIDNQGEVEVKGLIIVDGVWFVKEGIEGGGGKGSGSESDDDPCPRVVRVTTLPPIREAMERLKWAEGTIEVAGKRKGEELHKA